MEANEAINILVSRQDRLKQIDQQRQFQRRNTVSNSKADFQTMLRGEDRLYTGFVISKDMQYIMRYNFTVHIRPFVTTIDTTVLTNETSLSISDNSISPNPHTHTATLGIKVQEQDFDVSNLRVKINNIDITDAIEEEYGSFITGYGYFPEEDGEVFDIFKIMDYLNAWEQSAILSSGRKEIEISQDDQSLCECDISYSVDCNHVDRGGLY